MGAEVAVKRKCEKCVNHHKVVCNKRGKGRRKNTCLFFGIRAKNFQKAEKRERGIYWILFGISPFQALKQEKLGRTNWRKKR